MLKAVDQASGLRSARKSEMPRIGRSRRFRTRTIAVTSGKGGVGKTQLSANLGVSLSRAGQRVALLDADLGLASLDLALGVEPRADVMSVMNGEAELSDILLEAGPGLALIPACPGRYEMANLSTADRARLLDLVDELSVRFDTLVIDTGAGIGSNAVGFASAADEVLLVATPDPSSLRDAYAMAKVLHRRGGVDAIHVVANQVESEREGLFVYERLATIVERFLELDLRYLGAIPRDAMVGRCVVRGEPYVDAAPRCPAARAVDKLVRRLSGLGPVGAAC